MLQRKDIVIARMKNWANNAKEKLTAKKAFSADDVLMNVRKAVRFMKNPQFQHAVDKREWQLFVIYKIALVLMYAFLQHPLFGYSGYDLSLNLWRMGMGWLVYIGLIYVVQKNREDSVCSSFMYTLLMLSITPFIVYFELAPECRLWMLLLQGACFVFIAVLLFSKIPIPVRFTGVSYKNRKLHVVVLALLGIYVVYLAARFGLPGADAFSFEDVHNIRANVELSTLEAILQNVMCKAFCPLVLVVSLKEKKWLGIALALLVQVYTYSITGFKTYLFIPAIVLGMQILPALNAKKSLQVLLTAGVILLIVGYGLTQNTMLYALIGDRMLFMPARIKFAHFDYFSQHEFVNFSQNSFSSFLGLTSVYTSPVQYLIGDIYFNKPNMWTNTGFMADAYANWGIPGMILMSVLLCAVLIVLRDSLKNATPRMQKGLQSLYVIFFIALNDGPVISELFSGGMLASVVLIMLIDFSEEKRKFGFSWQRNCRD